MAKWAHFGFWSGGACCMKAESAKLNDVVNVNWRFTVYRPPTATSSTPHSYGDM